MDACHVLKDYLTIAKDGAEHIQRWRVGRYLVDEIRVAARTIGQVIARLSRGEAICDL